MGSPSNTGEMREEGKGGQSDQSGVFLSVQKALNFLSNDCGLVHRNVSLSSVFVDTAGEWKLGGVEFMVPFSDSAAVGPAGKILQGLRQYDPPESSKPAASRKTEKW